jgi:hypothetical protein
VLQSLLQSVRVCGCMYTLFVYITLVLVWRVVICTFTIFTVHLLFIIKMYHKKFLPQNAKGLYTSIRAQERRHVQLSASLSSFFFKCEICAIFSSEFFVYFHDFPGVTELKETRGRRHFAAVSCCSL